MRASAFRELNERLKTFQGWDFALEGYCPTFEVTDLETGETFELRAPSQDKGTE